MIEFYVPLTPNRGVLVAVNKNVVLITVGFICYLILKG